MKSLGSNKIFTLTHREMITTLRVGSGVTDFSLLLTQKVNPLNQVLFPWLSIIA